MAARIAFRTSCWYATSMSERLRCRDTGATVVLPGFWSSDCGRGTHLCWFVNVPAVGASGALDIWNPR